LHAQALWIFPGTVGWLHCLLVFQYKKYALVLQNWKTPVYTPAVHAEVTNCSNST